MSYQHFVKLNQKQISQDLLSNLNTDNFYDTCPETSEPNIALEHLLTSLDDQPCVKHYWSYKLNKYFEKYQDCVYPLVSSSSNLVSTIEMEVANINGAAIADTFYFYYRNFTLELEIFSTTNGSWSDGVTLDIVWYVKKGTPKQLETFLEILNEEDIIDRLGDESELWKLLDEESWIQADLIQPIFRNT